MAIRLWLRSVGPTAAVVCALAALAIWGNHVGWSLPKFSALFTSGDGQVADWCQEHNVPESECIECNASLLPPLKDYGWCKIHGVAQCPYEHPDVAQLASPPSVAAEDLERVRLALELVPRPENNSRCKLHQKRIQFASKQAIDKAGVDIAVAQRRRMIEAVLANGEIDYDQTRLAHLSSRVEGTVWRVEKQIGDRVTKGELLALIDSADIGKKKTDFLQAIAQVRLKAANAARLKPLAGGSVPEKLLREAETEHEEAQIQLISAQQALGNLGLAIRADDHSELTAPEIAERIQFLGLPAATIANLGDGVTTSNLFPLSSPLDGTIVDQHLSPGEVVDTRTTIVSVADVSRMQLVLDVRQEDAASIAMGQDVLFKPNDSRQAADIHGAVRWISTSADERTRTVKVRVDLPNRDGRLRAHTFGTGRIVLRDEPQAIVVPSEAVHRDGCCYVTFVRDKNFLKDGSPKFFHVRKVRPGVQDGDTTEILAGLLPGEVIASKNSVVLEAQLLKANLGEGCGCCKQ